MAFIDDSNNRFGKFQPEYAARGIATFPFLSNVEDKRPLVKGYGRVGLLGSNQLALKFDAPGIACMAGQRTKLTLVDIDAHGQEGERLLAGVERQYGRPKVIVRTGREGFHAYYRHNGEARKIRPDAGIPVDVLGAGVVVLPPSRGLICDYQFIEGTIDDLTDLPVMRGTIVPPLAPSAGRPSGLADLRRARAGERDKTIWPYIARRAHCVGSLEALIEEARELNEMFIPPETDTWVIKKCNYWWGKTMLGENMFGIGQHVLIDHAMIDDLMVRDPDAFNLLLMLKRQHWGRDFYFGNAMRETMGGWDRERFARARKTLIEKGLVMVISPTTPRSPMRCRLTDTKRRRL